MTSPITIDDLTEATSISATDLMIMETEPEQATYRATVSQMQSISIRELPALPSSMTSGDVFLVADSDNNKYSCEFDDITFESGTKIWISLEAPNAPPPLGWSISPMTGDKLLALVGGSVYTTPGESAGTWDMEGVNGGNPGSALNPNQIPSHRHSCIKYRQREIHDPADNGQPGARGKIVDRDEDKPFGYALSTFTGGNSSHNHGNTWRPKAFVGMIIEKD